MPLSYEPGIIISYEPERSQARQALILGNKIKKTGNLVT